MKFLNKSIWALTGCLTLGVMVCHAEIKLPKDCYESSKIAEAGEAAVKAKKPVAFLYVKKETDCPKAGAATSDFLKALGKKCVIVYLSPDTYKSDSAQLDKKVVDELQKSNIYPKLVIFELGEGKILYSTHYKEYEKDTRGTVRDIRKSLIPAR